MTTAEISTGFSTEQIGFLSGQNIPLVVVAIICVGVVIAGLVLRSRTRRTRRK